MKYLLLLFCQLILIGTVESQTLHSILNEGYDEHKNQALKQRRFKHADIMPLIERVKTWEEFKVSQAGTSNEGRSINLISFGEGPVNVLLWSQMHGDESTATQALFDIFNFLHADQRLSDEIRALRESLTIHFIPMLNPDGAERFQRRNAQSIDVNRDALHLQTPEGRILQQIHDSLGVSFGFNLHDQSRYYNAEGSSKSAAISVLAPAFNEAKDINEIRDRAMRLIVQMNEVLQVYAPGHVGRYSDDFEPRAFGDNIQSWGTSTILIESGGYPGDREKQFIRKLNYLIILESLFSIASKDYETASIDEYEQIPKNDSKLFDLKITNVKISNGESSYKVDIGINRNEVDNEDHTGFSYSAVIDDLGDLSTYHGYETLDADNFELEFGVVMKDYKGDVSDDAIIGLLNNGVAYVHTELQKDAKINLVGPEFSVPQELKTGDKVTFFLRSDEGRRYAVINGFLVDLRNPDLSQIKNALNYED